MTTPLTPAAPVLGHVEGVELIDTGSWSAMSGPFTPTPEIIAAAVAALDCPAVRRPVLKAGHGGQHGIGEPALGYVANLRLSNEGHTLIGDYRGMPGWLTEVDSDGQSVLASAYPDRSIEGEYGYICQLGHEHPFVVHAVALLGVERPAIGTLESLQELYGVVAATTPSPGGVLTYSSTQETPMPAPVTAAATTDDVRRAYYATPAGSDWDVWIREMYVDPPELIVDDDSANTISRVPYTCAPDGSVTFGDPQLVKVEYVAARTSAAPPVVAFASREESRTVATPATSTTPDPSPAPAAEPAAAGGTIPTEEPMTDTLSAGLRQRLGIADDTADEATLLAAVDQALAERAEPVAASTTTSTPAGTVLIEAGALEELRTQASAGAEAREQQLIDQRTRAVDAAVQDGRIPPARREHWLAQLAADPGAETVLVSLAAGTVPLTALGSDEGHDASVDAEFDRLFPTVQEA